MADTKTKKIIEEFEKILKANKIGVWEWSDEEEDNSDSEND